eukprot:SAG11_NODE_992_length_6262_cov_2.097193_3_plen_53_part_00
MAAPSTAGTASGAGTDLWLAAGWAELPSAVGLLDLNGEVELKATWQVIRPKD